MFQKGVRIKKFNLESIDLARPRAAGMSARLVALTSEMENEGGNEVKPEEIAALTPNELRAHNPGLVQTVEVEARKPLEDKISEMETTATAVQPTLSLLPEFRKLLGLKEDTDDLTTVQSVIAHLREQGKSIRDSILESVLAKKKLNGDSKDAQLARRVIVGEIRNMDFTLEGDAEKDEKMVTEMVNRVIDSSEELKLTVSEMEDTPAAPPVSNGGNGNKPRELKPGYTNSSIRVRSVTR
jgi:hypothetical protein